MTTIETGEIKRTFKLQKNNETIVLEDPNQNFSAEEIKELYANQYPELLNASIEKQGIVDGKITFLFSSIAGNKG